MGKITVKHYLNKRAKSRTLNGESFYPLYLQIIVAGHKAQLKSKIQEYISGYKGNIEKFFINKNLSNLVNDGYFSDSLIKRIENEQIFPVFNLFNDEIEIMTAIIVSQQPFRNTSFSLLNISQHYDLYLRDISQILDDAVRKYYLNELKKVFIDSTSKEAERKIFKIANFFIHYINWTNNFCDYYETTYEVLPSEIKHIENYLSEDLKKQIKATLAFRSRANFLKRYLDKTEKGKFPHVNYFDWQSEGKSFLAKEFLKIFGKQKANEYIQSIDLILSREIVPTMIKP